MPTYHWGHWNLGFYVTRDNFNPKIIFWHPESDMYSDRGIDLRSIKMMSRPTSGPEGHRICHSSTLSQIWPSAVDLQGGEGGGLSEGDLSGRQR